MQFIRTFKQDDATFVGGGVRVILFSAEGPQGITAQRIARLGGRVECVKTVAEAMAIHESDAAGCDLVVIDADGIGGREGLRLILAQMQDFVAKLPVIVVTKECAEQKFPQDRAVPTMLRAPLSPLALRVGFEHALRGRFAPTLH